jgi:flagellar assembly protein FliH
MSLLLKARHVTLVEARRTLALAAGAPAAPVDAQPFEGPVAGVPQRGPQAQDADAVIGALRRQLSGLEQAHTEQARNIETREEAAYQRGVERGMSDGEDAGLARAVRDHAEQLETLHAGVQEALDAFRAKLQAVETLALDLTQLALEKILGDPVLCPTLVVQTARHHLAQVATGSAIGIQVSAADFPEPDDLHEAFAALMQHTTLTVGANRQLRPGACLIELTLGRLDVSLPQQLAHVSATLEALRSHD